MVKSRNEVKDSAEAVKSKVRSRSSIDSKSKKMEADKKKAALAFAAELSPDKAVQKMAIAKLESSKLFDQIENVFSDQLTEYEQLCAAVEAKRLELESLSDKDIINTALEVLISESEEKSSLLEDAYLAKKISLEKQEAEYKEAVENSKSKIAKEYESFKDNIEFEKNKLHKQFEQNKLEFQTKFENDSKDQLRAFSLEMEDKRRELERFEKEHADMRDIYENYEQKVHEAVSKALEEQKKSLNSSHAIELKSLEINHNSKLKEKDSEIKSYMTALDLEKSRSIELRELNKSLQEQVSVLASKAMDVSSGQAVISALKEEKDKQKTNK